MKLRISTVMVSAIFIFCLLPLSASADDDLTTVVLQSTYFDAEQRLQNSQAFETVESNRYSYVHSFNDENGYPAFTTEYSYLVKASTNTLYNRINVVYGYPEDIAITDGNYFSIDFYVRDDNGKPITSKVYLEYSGNAYYEIVPIATLTQYIRNDTSVMYRWTRMYFETTDAAELGNLNLGYMALRMEVTIQEDRVNTNPTIRDYMYYTSQCKLIYGYTGSDVEGDIGDIISDNENTQIIISSISQFQNILTNSSDDDTSNVNTYNNRINQYFEIEDAMVNGSVDLEEWETIIESGDSAIISNASAINFISNIMQSFYNSIGADLRSVYGFWAFMCIFSVILASGSVIGRNVGKARDRNEYKDNV